MNWSLCLTHSHILALIQTREWYYRLMTTAIAQAFANIALAMYSQGTTDYDQSQIASTQPLSIYNSVLCSILLIRYFQTDVKRLLILEALVF